MSSYTNNPRPIIQTSKFKTKYSQPQRQQITFNQNSPYTKQSFKDECDINILMARYQATGELPNLNQSAPQYLDVTGYDFQEAMDFVRGAQTMFEELPSSIRNRFQNSPEAFLDFCSNENNRPELAAMGLLRPIAQELIPNPIPIKTNPTEGDSASLQNPTR